MKQKIKKYIKQSSQKLNIGLLYFIKSNFWLMLQKIVVTITGMISIVAFTRLCTQEIFGQYKFILSIFAMTSILALPGIDTSITQSVARGYEGSYKKTVKKSFSWALLGVPLLIIIGTHYYISNNRLIGLAIIFTSFTFPIIFVFNKWKSFLVGKSKFDLYAKWVSAQSIIHTVFLIGVIFFFRNNLILITTAYFLSTTFFNILWFKKTSQLIENNKKDPDTFKYGWFLTKIRLLEIAGGNIGNLLIGVLLGPVQLAIFTVGTKFPLMLKDIIKLFNRPLFNKFTKLPRSRVIKKNHYFLLTGIGIVTLIFFVFISKPLVLLFFGEAYSESVIITQVFLLAIPFWFLNLINYTYPLAQKNKKIVFYTSIFPPLIKILILTLLFVSKNLLIAVFANISYSLAIFLVSGFLLLKENT